MTSERFVTTADYDGTAAGRTHNWWREYSTDTHPAIGYTIAIIGELTRRPILLTSTAIAFWLLFRGLPLAIAVALVVIPQLIWSGRGLARLLFVAPRQRRVSQILPTLSMWWRTRGAWRVACVKAGVKQPGRRGSIPTLHSHAVTHTGFSALVDSGRWGYTQGEMASLAERAAAAAIAPRSVERALTRLPEPWGERLGLIPSARSVSVTPEDSAGQVRVWWSFTDPLAELVPPTALVRPPSNMLSLGVTEHGPPAMVFSFLPILIVGMQNSGKSNLLWTIVASALLKGEPFEIWAMDPKGGVELYELGQVAGVEGSIVREYARDRDGCRKMLAKVFNRMEMRENAMRGTGARYHVPTPEEPRIYLLIDELIRAHGHFTAKTSIEQTFVELLSNCRAAGITPVCCTQIPFGHSIGEKVRSLFPVKIVGRINDTFVTSAMFGPGAEALGTKATKIKVSTPGIHFMSMDLWPMPIRMRTPYWTNEVIRLLSHGVLPDGLVLREQEEHPEVAAPMGLRDNRDHALYRWDYPGEGCLYVGISNDVARRAMEHLSNREKAALMREGVTCAVVRTWSASDCAEDIMAGRTVRQVAEDYEAEMIRRLQPSLNIAHAGSGRRRKALTRA